MVLLTETSLMPGECVLKKAEIARELSFVIKGAVQVTDDRGTLIELISGDGTSPCVIGSVSFLMGTLACLVVFGFPALLCPRQFYLCHVRVIGNMNSLCGKGTAPNQTTLCIHASHML